MSMPDKIAQVMLDAIQALKLERAHHEAEIRRIDDAIEGFEKASKSSSSAPKRTLSPPVSTHTTTGKRAPGRKPGKDFWSERRSKALKK